MFLLFDSANARTTRQSRPPVNKGRPPPSGIFINWGPRRILAAATPRTASRTPGFINGGQGILVTAARSSARLPPCRGKNTTFAYNFVNKVDEVCRRDPKSKIRPSTWPGRKTSENAGVCFCLSTLVWIGGRAAPGFISKGTD